MKNKKIKIIYNISSTATSGGGMERVIVLKANTLAEKYGYDVLMITTDQHGKKSFYPYSENIRHIDLGLNYMEIAAKKPFLYSFLLYRIALIKHRRALEKILLQEKADIVVSLSRDEKEFLYKIKDGSKKVLETHRCLKPRAPIEIKKAKSWLMKLKINYRLIHDSRLPKYYDKFVTLTEEDKTFWAEKNNVEVIPNPLPFETEQFADYFAKRVLCVGRVSYDKGIDRLLNIWSRVSPDFPDWKLSLVGDVVDKELLMQISNLKLTDTVEVLPPTTSILDEYLSSSIFVMTSRFEGLSMVLLEAASVGLPLVSYAFKCGPRDVINDGKDGYLMEEDDEDRFVEKLKLLMKDEKLRAEMGKQSKINSRKFSSESVMERWNNLFRKLINKDEK